MSDLQGQRPADPVALPCVNHPDRLTYISCSRCGNPICPECMTAAPVGQQCPACVTEGQRSVRQVRTVFGGKAVSRPTVTYALIAANVAVFVLGLLGAGDNILNRFAMVPTAIANDGEYYRLFTMMFVHGGFLHIGFNMLVLWIVGQQLETLLGHSRYVVLYLVSGFAGGVASYWLSSPCVSAVGASGAIFGLMGGLLVAGRRLRYDVTQVAGLIAINLVIGFFIPNVDWRAHVGGLVGGLIMGVVFSHSPKRHRLAVEIGGTALILIVLVALTLLRGHYIAPTACTGSL